MNQRRELKLLQVDVFTDTPYGGNPAAVILAPESLDESEMEKIANEMNVRETVFVLKSKVADHRFRYMTPGGEVDFSGHATIAAFHALIHEGLVEIYRDETMVSFETRAGLLQADIVKNETTRLHEVQITHQKPQFLDTYDPNDYNEALGITLADIDRLVPMQTVTTGIPIMVIPLSTSKAFEKVDCDWNRLIELQKGSDFGSVCVFTRDTHDETSDAQVRHFAPSFGVNEDAVSGAAAACVASYMIRYGIIDDTLGVASIVIEQGHSIGRPGRENIELVKVSGTGIVVMTGTLLI
ncbi:MAG: PhzF family phenazine biosynthesis protein [Candidatus Thorarchaeota archaeon]